MESLVSRVAQVCSYSIPNLQEPIFKGDLIGRKTLFPISLWNHYQNAVCGLARTTNAVEGWHLGVTALFQGSHPSIHTFLEKIQLDSYNQKFNILKASSGTINLSRKKYRDLNEKVQQITSSYTDSNLCLISVHLPI